VVHTEIVAYDVYLNYPVDHRLALLKKDGDKTEVTFEASLEEDVLEEDHTSGLRDRVPTFHGYSASGNVTAPFVYVNFGTYHDYQDLVDANVSLAGKIAIAKYGRIFRGLKVKRAQELGMVGVILYDDPQEDGDITEDNGHKPYPEGPARNPSAVQRGSAQFLSMSSFAFGPQALTDTYYCGKASLPVIPRLLVIRPSPAVKDKIPITQSRLFLPYPSPIRKCSLS
jgi:N-acetylated-alpha-linked acidic dipeptidase